jgi:transcriptional regulator with XRE-family HTH domain
MTVLLRHEIGDVFRDYRTERGMTLRDLSGESNVAVSYLSELERGQKEASSEVLLSISNALGYQLSEVLIEASTRLSLFEDAILAVNIPDTVPVEDIYPASDLVIA